MTQDDYQLDWLTALLVIGTLSLALWYILLCVVRSLI
jgi:hypothetical protein